MTYENNTQNTATVLGERGPQGERGLRGDDGYSLLSSLDTFFIICNESGMCLDSYTLPINIKAFSGKREVRLKILDLVYGEMPISMDNSNYEINMTISIPKGSIFTTKNGFIKLNLLLDETFTQQKIISWSILTQPNILQNSNHNIDNIGPFNINQNGLYTDEMFIGDMTYTNQENVIFITPKNTQEGFTQIGGEDINTSDSNIISINNLRPYSQNFTKYLHDNLYISSDRISKTDLPLTSRCDVSKTNYLSGDITINLTSSNKINNLNYEFKYKIYNSYKIIAEYTIHKTAKNVGTTYTCKCPFFNAIYLTDKTLKLGMDVNISSDSNSEIECELSIEEIKIYNAPPHTQINNNGLCVYENDTNKFKISQTTDDLEVDFTTTNKNTSLLPIMLYGSVTERDSYIYGKLSNKTKGVWDKINSKHKYRISFDYNTNGKYMVVVTNTHIISSLITVIKMDRYLDIIFDTPKPTTFDFIIYQLP